MFHSFSISDIIGIISGMATFGTVFVTFRTIKEMEKQRESLYLPEITIDTFTVKVFGEASPEKILFSKFKTVNNFDREFQITEDNTSRFIKVRLQNVGLGAAKRIKCKWDFDFIAADEQLRVLPNYESSFSDFNATYGSDELVEHSLSLIMPFDDLYISIPRVVWVHYLYFFALRKSLDDAQIPKYYNDKFTLLPRPTLTINYTDIQNNVFRKDFNFSFSISVASEMNNPNYIAIFTVRVDEKFKVKT